MNTYKSEYNEAISDVCKSIDIFIKEEKNILGKLDIMEDLIVSINSASLDNMSDFDILKGYIKRNRNKFKSYIEVLESLRNDLEVCNQ